MRESHFQRVQFKFSFFSKKIDDFIIIDPVTSIPDPPFLILDPRSFFSRTSIEWFKAKLDTSQYKWTTSHKLATLEIDISAFSNEKTGKRPGTMQEIESIPKRVFVWYRVVWTLGVIGEWLGVKIFLLYEFKSLFWTADTSAKPSGRKWLFFYL